MRVKYFSDTDTTLVEMRELDENIYLDLDEFSYQRMPALVGT